MVGQFRELVRGAARGPLEVPIVSTVTGAWATEEQLADPDYWAIAPSADGPVLRRRAPAARSAGPDPAGGWSGPDAGVARAPAASRPADRLVLASLRHPRQEISDQESMFRALGEVWAAGGLVDWVAVHGGRRQVVSLPTYPFDPERHWIDPVTAPPGVVSRTLRGPRRRPFESRPSRRSTSRPRGHLLPSQPTTPRRPPSPPMPRRTRGGSGSSHGWPPILSELSGVDPAALDPSASFADLGFDSLFLTQANAQFRKQFGVRITFRQIFEEAPSINSLAGFIDSKLAPDAFPGPERKAVARVAVPAQGMNGAKEAGSMGVGADVDGTSISPMERLIREQLRIMEQQLALMSHGQLPATAATAAPGAAATALEAPEAPERRARRRPGLPATTSRRATRDAALRATAP